MNPSRVDFAVDLAYGVMIFVAIVLITVEGTRVGVAFGLGVLVSYALHVTWKMGRFDPDWMTMEVAENVERTLTREVEEVTENVEETVSQEVDEVTKDVEETVSREVDEVKEKLEDLDERVDRRPRRDEIEETADGLTAEGDESIRSNGEDRD